MANAVFDYMVQEADIQYLDDSEREELQDFERRMEELEQRIENEEDDNVMDDLVNERDELQDDIDSLKGKNNDVYGLLPEGTHYDLKTFRSIHDETSGNVYAVGTESEADSSVEEYYEEMINDLNQFDKSTLSYHIDGDDVADYYEDMIREWVMDDPSNYDVSRETSLSQDKEIEKLQNQKRSLEIETYLIKSGARSPLTEEEVESMKYFKFNDYMGNILIVEWSENKWQIYQNGKKVESVTYEDEDEDGEHESDNDSRMDEIESEIEDIDVEIQDIRDDPDGDLNEEEVENAVEERLDQIKDDPVSWLDEMGDQYENFVNKGSLLRDLVDEADYGILSNYDGNYDTITVNDSTFVVMRIE
jgi:predicted  nucleic acid-binding Zn-ribbon protein